MSNEIRRKPEMTKNPYNDIKLLLVVIISLFFFFIKKIYITNFKKNINLNTVEFAKV